MNIGCAHGPDFLPFKQNFELHGIDFSIEMLSFAQKYSSKFNFQTNLSLSVASQLPYRDESFDWAISVAVYHHIESKELRKLALNELWRILKPQGEAFITVWNRWQPRFWFKEKEALVPWHKSNSILYRYHYLFSYSELEKLTKEVGFQILESSGEDSYRLPLKFFSRNICLLIKKT